jgi:hypothetical protein
VSIFVSFRPSLWLARIAFCRSSFLIDLHCTDFSRSLADLIAALATKFGLAPEIGWLQLLLHIIIEGVHIEHELGAALTDFGASNWVGFGWEVASLIKTLL